MLIEDALKPKYKENLNSEPEPKNNIKERQGDKRPKQRAKIKKSMTVPCRPQAFH